MVTFTLLLIAAFGVGYAIGCTRSRDRLPREIYDRNGKRIF